MSFNKTKAMRNAERYLTQGKIQAAISEYKQVVENDPKDINSRNMLGDLYIKADDTQAAVNCYQEVADHYNTQGFAKKAIAIYNKIYRIEPDSIEVVAKLAELYQVRGSMAEAQGHYEEIAKRYEDQGRKIEALAVWEKIAEISPRDTEIYVKIADAYWKDDRKEESAKAFIEAGKRLAETEQYEAAVTAFSRSLEVNPEDHAALRGFVQSQLALGYPEEAAKALEKVLENEPYNKEINYLLMDCYFDMGSPENAEELIVRLVEREPANYPKLLDLVTVYLENDNLDSATRILSMTSEHLLVGGESEQLNELLNEVLARNPEHIAALRLLARYHGWQRDELELQQTLERLAESAYLNNSIEDERYALSQYLILVPHDVDRSNRLKEINSNYDFGDVEEEQLLHTNSKEVPTFESFATLSEDTSLNGNDFQMVNNSDVMIADEFNTNGNHAVSGGEPSVEAQIIEQFQNNELSNENGHQPEEIVEEVIDKSTDAELDPSDEVRVDDEINSIKFYIEQGYTGLAEKSLNELENEFGKRQAFIELRNQISGPNSQTADIETSENTENIAELQTFETNAHSKNGYAPTEKIEVENFEAVHTEDLNSDQTETSETALKDENTVRETSMAEEQISEVADVEDTNVTESEEQKYANPFEDFKDELGLDDVEEEEENDFEEHYQHAVVYQEMGMLEEAIREFQDAVNCIEVNDGTSRYLNCCSLIGHCFMQKGMPNLALGWFEKAFEISDLNEQEKIGLQYELANAYEADEQLEKALDHFELIYSLDVDYRDVGERVESLRQKIPTLV